MTLSSNRLFSALLGAAVVSAAFSPALAAEVNVYSARQEALIKPLLDKFTQSTGIAVNLVTGKDDALLTRLESEGANSPADLLFTADAGRLFRAKQAGLTQPLDDKALAAVPAQYRDPEGHWAGLSVRARPIMYVVGKVKADQLSTYEDLADPKWKGRICIRSSDNIYNQSMMASMIAAKGEQGALAWAKGLVANFAQPPKGGDRDQVKAAAAGICDIAIANTYYLAGMLTSAKEDDKAAAAKVAVFWPNQSDRGAHVNVSGAALTKASKNKDAATKLVAFLLTPESQGWYAEANGEYPVTANVAPSALLAGWGTFKADGLNLAKLGENNAAAVRLMDQAGWK